MVNRSEAPHFRPDGLQHPRRKSVFIAKWVKDRKKPTICVFYFYKDRQEDSLMGPITRKQHGGEFLKGLHTIYPFCIEINLRSDQRSYPAPFVSNKASDGEAMLFHDVKIFGFSLSGHPAKGLSPKTVGFWAAGGQAPRFNGKPHLPEEGYSSHE
jgi:hypothetical protein